MSKRMDENFEDEDYEGEGTFSRAKEGHLNMFGKVCNESVSDLEMWLNDFKEDPSLILDMTLNLEGGDAHAMFAMHDLIRSYGEINVKAIGTVYSAAVLLVACCSGKRTSGKHTVFMIHRIEARPHSLVLAKIKIEIEELTRLSTWWVDLMTEYTKKPREFWHHIAFETDEDFHISADQALEYGIIDEVF